MNFNLYYISLLILSLLLIIFQEVNFLPIFVWGVLMSLGIYVIKIRTLFFLIISLLVLLLTKYNATSYAFLINGLFYIIPLLLGYTFRLKFSHLSEILHSSLAFFIPFLLISILGINPISLTYFVFLFITILILNCLILLGNRVKRKIYLITSSILVTFYYLTELYGIYMDVSHKSVSILTVFYVVYLLTLFFVYMFINNETKQSKLYLNFFKTFVIIVISFYSFSKIILNKLESNKQNRVVTYKNKMDTIQLFDKNNKLLLLNLKSNDKTIILNTWATWCFPCIRKLKLLNDSNEHFTRNEFFVSFEDSAIVYQFIKKHDLKIPIFYIPKDDLKEFESNLNIFPSTLKITKDSIIIYKGQ